MLNVLVGLFGDGISVQIILRVTITYVSKFLQIYVILVMKPLFVLNIRFN
jgi:type IV secretory pathway VirB6-like protein